MSPPSRHHVRILLLAAGCLGLPGGLAGQEGEQGGAPPAPPPEPRMAEAPRQFRVAATAGSLLWAAEPDRASIDGGGLFGLEVERRIGRFLAFRAGGVYGRTAASEGEATAGLNQYVIDLVASVRLALAPARRAGVVPFGTLGVGTVVHDPEPEELVTKSQSAAAFGIGVDVDLGRRWGVRAEWRRYLVDSEDLFDPTERTGRGRPADRLYGGVLLAW